MWNRTRLTVPIVFAVATALGCRDEPVVAPSIPDVALLGKAGPTNSAATFRLPLPGATLSVTGDGLFPDGTTSKYADGVCGVIGTIFQPNPTRDAVMQTDNPSAGDRKCVAYSRTTAPRNITVDYGNGIESNPVTLNVHDMGSVVGTELRFLGIGFGGTSRCSKLQFGGPAGGDQVWVTKTSGTSWHVYSQASPANTASCITSSGNVLYSNMNVDLVVTTP